MPANRVELEDFALYHGASKAGRVVANEFSDLIYYGHHYSRVVWEHCADYISTKDPYWLSLARAAADRARKRQGRA